MGYRIQKQAQRRQQALLFMKTKKQSSPQYQTDEVKEDSSKKIEDIFDISDDDECKSKIQYKSEQSRKFTEGVSTKGSLKSTVGEESLVCEVPKQVLENKKNEEKIKENVILKDEIDICVDNVISNKSSKKYKRKRRSSSSEAEKYKKSKKKSKKSKKSSKSSKKKKSKRNGEVEISHDKDHIDLIPSTYREASSRFN